MYSKFIVCGISIRIIVLTESNNYKKFWEELMAYFHFTIIWVSDTTSRKKTVVCMRNEVSKTIRFGSLQCWYYWWEFFMKCTIEMASEGMIYVPHFMKIGTCVQAIWRFCFRNLRSCNVDISGGRDLWIYGVEDSVALMHVRTKFHKDWINSDVNRGVIHTDTDTHRQQGDLISLHSFSKLGKYPKNCLTIRRWVTIF
jgi:hypothetical protein